MHAWSSVILQRRTGHAHTLCRRLHFMWIYVVRWRSLVSQPSSRLWMWINMASGLFIPCVGSSLSLCLPYAFELSFFVMYCLFCLFNIGLCLWLNGCVMLSLLILCCSLPLTLYSTSVRLVTRLHFSFVGFAFVSPGLFKLMY